MMLIRFFYLPCPHNKYTISWTLVECLKSFNLDEKISTITLDNCTTNDVVVDVLLEKLQPSKLMLYGSFLRMRCCVHILNLVVQDGLEIISGAIEKVRSVVAFCTSSPNRYEKFEDACKSCGNTVIESMAKAMILKFDKYWEVVNGMLSVASILDPRRKFECVSFYFELLCEDTDTLECERILRILKDLVNEYETVPNENFTPFSPSSHSNKYNKRIIDDSSDVEGLWEKHVF